jgi:hypothetical protein
LQFQKAPLQRDIPRTLDRLLAMLTELITQGKMPVLEPNDICDG